MSYTNNIVSLETLQRELSLKTFTEPNNIQNERLPDSDFDDYIAKLDNIQEIEKPLVTEQPMQPVAKKPSIDVVYGNRSTNN